MDCPFSRDRLHQMYWREHMSVDDIALFTTEGMEEWCDPSEVEAWLIDAGIAIDRAPILVLTTKGSPSQRRAKRSRLPTGKGIRYGGKVSIPCPWTKDELYDLYWNQEIDTAILAGMATKMGGREFLLHHVINWMKRYEIPRRTLHEAKVLLHKQRPEVRMKTSASIRAFMAEHPEKYRKQIAKSGSTLRAKTAAKKAIPKCPKCLGCGQVSAGIEAPWCGYSGPQIKQMREVFGIGPVTCPKCDGLGRVRKFVWPPPGRAVQQVGMNRQ